jgi:hypothetical protein
MPPHRLSFIKSFAVAAIAGLSVVVLVHLAAPSEPRIARALIIATGWILGLVSECIAIGGLIALYRDKAQSSGKMDLFLALNRARSEDALADGRVAPLRSFRRWRRLLGAGALIVGDLVEIRSREEIEQTLDPSGALDGLPFMSEMARFCGQRARVFRCVDKIYDYGRSKKLRRIDDTVLLCGLRCDGSAHGDCQASCYLIWKTKWLRPIPGTRAGDGASGHQVAPTPLAKGTEGAGQTAPIAQTERLQPEIALAATERFTCQFTELAAASSPLRPRDFRQELRPLAAGNVTLGAFFVAILTRAFNAFQRLRGGSGYPALSPSNRTSTPIVNHGLTAGDTVRVLAMDEIAATLDRTSRNRGLWFDRELVKHCGRRYTVLKRIDRIIDDASGRMLRLKTPCIVLAGADASGEFLRFCAQHEHSFWREAWLHVESRTGAPPDSAVRS